MSKWRWDRGREELVPIEQWQPPARAVSPFPCPMVISDHCEVQSMADGRTYTSKSTYYRSLKDHGCEIVGNDPAWKAENAKPRREMPSAAADIVETAKEIGYEW